MKNVYDNYFELLNMYSVTSLYIIIFFKSVLFFINFSFIHSRFTWYGIHSINLNKCIKRFSYRIKTLRFLFVYVLFTSKYNFPTSKIDSSRLSSSSRYHHCNGFLKLFLYLTERIAARNNRFRLFVLYFLINPVFYHHYII